MKILNRLVFLILLLSWYIIGLICIPFIGLENVVFIHNELISHLE